MDINNANAGLPPELPPLTGDARIAFWRHYERWLFSASVEELAQLEAALAQFKSAEVQSLAVLIRTALKDEAQRRQYPASLLSPLEEANWPDAAANG